MADVSRSNTAKRAGEELGLVPVGQSLASNDNTRILQAYDEVYRQLEEKGLATWASDGSVPEKAAKYVVSMVAYNCLDTYPVSSARYQRINKSYIEAVRELPNVIRNDYDDGKEPEDF